MRRRRRGPWMPRPPLAVRRPRRGPPGPARDRLGCRVDATLGFVAAAFRRHAELLVEFFEDEDRGCRDIRKHVAWYFKGYPVGGETRAPARDGVELAEIDELLATLDWTQPYPGAAAEGQRGRAGTPSGRRCPTAGWTSRELDGEHPASSPKRSSTTVADELPAFTARPAGYGDADAERCHPSSTGRGAATSRATARGCCTPRALRRLAAKTQVLSPASPADFARNRLTHSLEVAQVGRELGDRAAARPRRRRHGVPRATTSGTRRSVTTASGRSTSGPTDIGGFEGNAQTLRIAHPARAEGRRRGRPGVRAQPHPGEPRRHAASTRGPPLIRSPIRAGG